MEYVLGSYCSPLGERSRYHQGPEMPCILVDAPLRNVERGLLLKQDKILISIGISKTMQKIIGLVAK
jgi:hypothetical protein